MTTATIYTIEREFGSAGHIVGERLAKMLGIPFYDSQIVDMAAENAARFSRGLMKSRPIAFCTRWSWEAILRQARLRNPLTST